MNTRIDEEIWEAIRELQAIDSEIKRRKEEEKRAIEESKHQRGLKYTPEEKAKIEREREWLYNPSNPDVIRWNKSLELFEQRFRRKKRDPSTHEGSQ